MLKAIEGRYSVRAYKPDRVPEDALQVVLEAALHAPTACNFRPWHIVVVEDAHKRGQLSRMHQYSGFCAQAPVVLAFCAEEKLSPHWWVEDCCAAAENAMIQAVDLGLGTCWIGVRAGEDMSMEAENYVRATLGIPEGVRVLCLVSLGYPDGPAAIRPAGPMENVHRDGW